MTEFMRPTITTEEVNETVDATFQVPQRVHYRK